MMALGKKHENPNLNLEKLPTQQVAYIVRFDIKIFFGFETGGKCQMATNYSK
jgi:hypothetical protein